MRRFLYILLILVGSLQIIGVAVSSRSIKGVGLASVAAPLPLVFSHFRGIETFAADFYLRLKQGDKIVFDSRITSEMYEKLRGPYNRRNIYGAVFAYGPVLTEPSEKLLVNSILQQGFCHNGPLVEEFDLPSDFDLVAIEVQTKTKGKKISHLFGIQCK